MSPASHFWYAIGRLRRWGKFRAPLRRLDLERWLWRNRGAPGGSIEEITSAHGQAQHQAQHMMDLEPELEVVVSRLAQGRLPFLTGRRQDVVAVAWRELAKCLRFAPQRVIVVPSWAHESMAYVKPIVRLALEQHGPNSVLLVAADSALERGAPMADGFDGVDCISLAGIRPRLSPEGRVEILLLLLRALAPDAVLCVSGPSVCGLLEQYGRALATFTRVHVLMLESGETSRMSLSGGADPCVNVAFQHSHSVLVDVPPLLDGAEPLCVRCHDPLTKVRVLGRPTAEEQLDPGSAWDTLRDALRHSPSFLSQ